MFIWLTLFFLAIDLGTKTWADIALEIGEGQETTIPYITWQLLYNEGMSFSLLAYYPQLVLILNFVAICVVFVLIKYIAYSFMWNITSALIIAGGFGNFINRLFSGHVVDFISVQGYPAIFNMEKGYQVKTSVIPLDAVPRALVNHETTGVFKIVAEADTLKVLGVHLVAENAGDVIYAATLVVKHGLTIEDLQESFAPYLTMAEGLKLTALTFDKDVSKLSCCAG